MIFQIRIGYHPNGFLYFPASASTDTRRTSGHQQNIPLRHPDIIFSHIKPLGSKMIITFPGIIENSCRIMGE